jgi:glutamine synthetase
VFDGDNYAQAWHKEAAKRGLPHLRSTAEALPVLRSKSTQELFEKYGVLNKRELNARVDVLLETYVKTMDIEARTLISMLKQQVLPAALRFQAELVETVAATKSAGLSCPDTTKSLKEVIELITELRKSIEMVEKANAHKAADAEKHAMYIHQKLVPAMARVRAASDALEEVIPDDLWTLPTYAEMLFVR